MSDSVALLGWDEQPIRTVQDADWTLEDREDSANELKVITSLPSVKDVKSDQELIFRNRRFKVTDVDRTRSDGEAELSAEEVQAELADLVLVEYKPNSWTLEQAAMAALEDTRWTIGEMQGSRYGRADFEDISVLEALKFLARHQDGYLSFDSLNRRVSILQTQGTVHEVVFTYGRQLTDIEKSERNPKTTVIYPTGAEGLTIASVNDGVEFVEDYGYYVAQGLTLEEARQCHRREDYWSDERYTVAENMLRDAQKRLEDEAYPAITYTLKAAATTAVEGSNDFDLGELHLGDKVYVWDDEIDARLQATVAAVTTSSDASKNELTLSTLPESLGAGVEGRYFGDSGRPSDGPGGRPGLRPSGPQTRPSMPILEGINNLGVGEFRWNGQDHEGSYATIPELFGEVETIAAPVVDGVIPDPEGETAFAGGSIPHRGGGTAHISFGTEGEYAVWFRMVGRDGFTRSAPSEPWVGEVSELVDTAEIEQQLEQDRARLAAAEAKAQEALDETGQVRDEWAEEYPRLQQEITDAQAAVADAEARLGQAEQSITDTRLGMENLRDVRLPGLQDTLNNGLADANEWREVGAISADNILIGRGANLIPNASMREGDSWPIFWRESQDAPGFTRTSLNTPPGSDRAVYVTGRHTYTTQPFPVEGGQKYRFRMQAQGDRSGKRFYVQLVTDGDTNPYIFSNEATQNYVYREFAAEVVIPDGATEVRIRVHANHQNGDTTEGVQWFGGWQMYAMATGELIVDGSISARHIIAEEIAAAVAEFLELHAGQITAGQIDTDLLNVADLAARIATVIELHADRITTGKLAAERIDIVSLFANSAFINDLQAAVITSLSVTAERGFIGGALLEDDSITVGKLTALDEIMSELGRFLRIEADSIASNIIEGMTVRGGLVEGATVRGSRVEVGPRYDGGSGQSGVLINPDGGNQHFISYSNTGAITARLGGARNELRNLSVGDLFVDEELRVGTGTGAGRIAPDGNRFRIQGLMPFTTGAARDTFMYGISSALYMGDWVGGADTWDVQYPEPRPSNNSAPLVTTTPQAGGEPNFVVAKTVNETASGFTALAFPLRGGSGISNYFFTRYLSMWRG